MGFITKMLHVVFYYYLFYPKNTLMVSLTFYHVLNTIV